MLADLPVLANYGVSPTHGFLPDEAPLTRLPDPYYQKWEIVVAELQALILTRRIRAVADNLPVLSTTGLEHDAEWRRAYSLLCFMAHAYVWGGDQPADKLPAGISVPLLEVSKKLELPPVATYAALCLWNFKPLFSGEPMDNLENLATLNTFTGSLDESWFYLISVAIEARGGPMIQLMMTAMAAARRGEAAMVTQCLATFAERLTDLTAILQRMHENCDPTIFFHRIRPFFAGSKNMAEAGLPCGLMYEDADGHVEYRRYSGGSNAQSSLIQFFDIVLGITHRPTGEKVGHATDCERQGHPPPQHNFIQEMRQYMPGPHARFLEHVAEVANIRSFVESTRGNRELCLAYDACLAMLSAFRDVHINIVARYIVMKAKEARARSRSRSPELARRRTNLATATRNQQRADAATDSDVPHPAVRNGKNMKGTGGTALLPFLKQARDETGEPAVEAWIQRFMKRKSKVDIAPHEMATKEWDRDPHDQFRDPSDSNDLGGLAGVWAMDEEVGGICNY